MGLELGLGLDRDAIEMRSRCAPPILRMLSRVRCRCTLASTCTMTTPGSPLGPLVASTYLVERAGAVGRAEV